MSQLKRVIRKIRNILFPHKHNKIVYEIRYYQSYIKAIKTEINKYNELMEHGYLGDALWQKYHWLHDNKELPKSNLRKLLHWFNRINFWDWDLKIRDRKHKDFVRGGEARIKSKNYK